MGYVGSVLKVIEGALANRGNTVFIPFSGIGSDSVGREGIQGES